MPRFYRRLNIKIGAIIVLSEVLVLAALGMIYVDRFSDQVDRRLVDKAQLPGLLMNAGLLSFDSVADAATMQDLVGEELVSGLVVGVGGNIFYALDPTLLGKNVADVPGIELGLFETDDPQDTVVHMADSVVSVSPIFAADRRTPRFFSYIRVGTGTLSAEKTNLTRVFVLGSAAAVLLTSLTIIFSFNLSIARRLCGLVGILRRVEVGDLTAQVEGRISRDEIGFLQRSTNAMVVARRQAEAQIIHLNRVLRAIRNVNQLITQERDLDRLLDQACRRLTETTSYASAWIVLLDEDGAPAKFAGQGLGGDGIGIAERIERGERMRCLAGGLAQGGVQVVGEASGICADCLLLGEREPVSGMVVRLEHLGTVYGALYVSVLSEYAIDAEELSLFDEVAGDISFALFNIGLEKERARAEEALRESEARYRTLITQMADGFALHEVICDRAGTPVDYRFLEVNPMFERLTGLCGQEIVGKTVLQVLPQTEEHWIAFYGRVALTGQPERRESHSRHMDKYFEVLAYRPREGQFATIFSDVTERRQVGEQLKTSLQETQLLVRELYHRTRNNMQVIISMLMLQAGSTDDVRVKAVLRDTRNRIQSMALVHEKLYQSQNLSSLYLDEYIRDLTQLLMDSYQVAEDRIDVVLDLERIVTLIDIAVPCGLILNELVSNALRHAFPADQGGQIVIGLHRSGPHEIVLEVADDGLGVPTGLDFRETCAFGLHAVATIAEHQLQGRTAFESENGVRCRVWFRDDLYEERV
jgi:PAS domain S-box-containing protein